jgi:hypothetical protein
MNMEAGQEAFDEGGHLEKPALFARIGTILGLSGGEVAGSFVGVGFFGFFGLPLRAFGRYPGALRASSQTRRFML